MKRSKILFFLAMIFVAAWPYLGSAEAGNGGGKGEEPRKAQKALIDQVIRFQLKSDLLSFLSRLDLRVLQEFQPVVYKVFQAMLQDQLPRYLKNSQFKPAEPESCKNEKGETVSASALGKNWGDVPCLDSWLLSGEYSTADALIIRVRLLATSVHEYAHEARFDDGPAYEVTGFVRLMAPAVLAAPGPSRLSGIRPAEQASTGGTHLATSTASAGPSIACQKEWRSEWANGASDWQSAGDRIFPPTADPSAMAALELETVSWPHKAYRYVGCHPLGAPAPVVYEPRKRFTVCTLETRACRNLSTCTQLFEGTKWRSVGEVSFPEGNLPTGNEFKRYVGCHPLEGK